MRVALLASAKRVCGPLRRRSDPTRQLRACSNRDKVPDWPRVDVEKFSASRAPAEEGSRILHRHYTDMLARNSELG